MLPDGGGKPASKKSKKIGNTNTLGRKHTPETRAKMSVAHRGRK